MLQYGCLSDPSQSPSVKLRGSTLMQVGIGGPQMPLGVDMDIVVTEGSSQLGAGVYVGYRPPL